MKIQRYLGGHILFYGLIFFIILSGSVSYYRFLVKHDYVVSYEGACDPTQKRCFIGCKDDECTKTYYYSHMQKYAPDLYAECGENVIGCEAANACLSSDRNCSVVYCESNGYEGECSGFVPTVEETTISTSTEPSLIKNTSVTENK